MDNTLTIKTHACTYLFLLNELSSCYRQILYPSKFIILVRDPRVSLISAYHYSYKTNEKGGFDLLNDQSFGPLAPGIARSNYQEYYKTFVGTWLQYVEDGSAILVRFEDLVSNPSTINEVLGFLDQSEVRISDDHKLREWTSEAAVSMQEKWPSVAVSEINPNSEDFLPMKQYPQEYGSLTDYLPLIEQVEKCLKTEIQMLGYEINYFDDFLV